MEYLSGGIKRRPGRPRKDDPRTIAVTVKLNDKELERLVFLSERHDLSVSETIRKAIKRMYYEV